MNAPEDALIVRAAEALWPRGPGMLGWYGAVMKATAVIAAVRDQIAAEAWDEGCGAAADEMHPSGPHSARVSNPYRKETP